MTENIVPGTEGASLDVLAASRPLAANDFPVRWLEIAVPSL